ncbi:MAG: hydrogenase maturation nickel metallochaperone HypA [Roseovarius sp.]
MHETSLALSLVDLVAQRARAEGARAVRRVAVAVGALGHVEPEALAFALQSARNGGLLADTAFDIRVVPGRAFCFDCADLVEISERGADCPRCGGARLTPAAGEELKVTEMEIV